MHRIVPTWTLGISFVLALLSVSNWYAQVDADPLYSPESYAAGMDFVRAQPAALRDLSLVDCKVYAEDGMAEADGYSSPSFVSGCYEVVVSGQ